MTGAAYQTYLGFVRVYSLYMKNLCSFATPGCIMKKKQRGVKNSCFFLRLRIDLIRLTYRK